MPASETSAPSFQSMFRLLPIGARSAATFAFPGAARRLDGFSAPTVWHEFSPLAQQFGAVNLGQGFPDWAPPDFVQKALVDAVGGSPLNNQYTRSQGHSKLVDALAEYYGKQFGRQLDPMTQITTAVGSTEALYMTFAGLCNPGDEVMLIEPAFDLYAAQAQMAGARTRSVPLRYNQGATGSGAFTLDPQELAAALTDQTRLLVLNNPHNPVGKVFSTKELTEISLVVEKFPNLMVLTDEVYENMTYGTAKHVRFASLPGMWDRTVTVSSAGKTFSVTGWKVGWAVGPEELISPLSQVGQWTHFSVPTITQEAVATSLALAANPYEGHPNYFAWLAATYLRKRDLLVETLEEAGLNPVVPCGGFFVLCDTSQVDVPIEFLERESESCVPMTRDWAFCRYSTEQVKVAAIPPSAFYCQENKHLAANLARFAFCKSDDVLHEARKRLLQHFG